MDSYRGNTVRLRYVIRVTVSRGMGGFSDEFPIWVQNSCPEMPPQEQIKVRVRILDAAWRVGFETAQNTTWSVRTSLHVPPDALIRACFRWYSRKPHCAARSRH